MKRKFHVLLFLASLTFIACSNDDNAGHPLESKLVHFEKNLVLKKEGHTLEDLEDTKNAYNSYGKNLLNSIDVVYDYVNKHPKSTAAIEELHFIIESEIAKVNPDDITFNEDEQLLFDSFIESAISSSDPVATAMEYEDFACVNYQDQSQIKNFLIVVSEYKYATFARKRTLRQIEACADECMEDNYASYGLVKWAQFALNPGADVLWNYAACIEDCWE